MPFGLMNAPATFQKMINSIFNDMLDMGMLAFLDDITIYAKTLEELDKLTIEVLKRLRDNGLCIAPDKCEWQNKKSNSWGTCYRETEYECAMTKLKQLNKSNQSSPSKKYNTS